ncbi:hypothetical protein [Parasitella parasitica]|uniref:Uncharacterized protein n=1 Tax=Parasitella parasitica TaxID=35722 RepID=A0A0B7NVZ7_9FUNG|nr:hypothetical protein [Parasitella parasitica]
MNPSFRQSTLVMEEASNISVRDAVDRLERSTEDFSVPGYLRTTASSNNKYNSKRKIGQGNGDSGKRQRFQNTNSVVPTKKYDGSFYEDQESQESSIFSISSTTRGDMLEDEAANQEQFEKLCLYAKYLQWVFLYDKAKIAFEHKKKAIEAELSLAIEAVKEKRIRETNLFKEKNEMLDDGDVRKYIQQAQRVANKLKKKLAMKDYDLGNLRWKLQD